TAHGTLDAVARHAFTEEHDVGLQDAAAVFTGRHIESGEVTAFEVGVPVRRFTCIELRPGGIRPEQALLKLVPALTLLAGHAPHGVESTVQVDDVAAAGGLVKTVHVLGDEQLDAPFPL